MSRPKGSKNKSTLARMQSVEAEIAALTRQKEALEAAQADIVASINEANAALKANKKDIRNIDKRLLKLESAKAEADAAAAAEQARSEIQNRVTELFAQGKSLDDILGMMQ